jgi:ribonuclease HI
MSEQSAEIYTDGSCHTQNRVGAWAAIILTGTEKKVLSGIVQDTTHNRMELAAVIKGIEYLKNNYQAITTIKVFSDSQYVTGLRDREEKLTAMDFFTKKGAAVQNADLVKELLALFSTLPVELIKVKAHQKKTGTVNYNIEADKLSRKMVRDASNKVNY